MGRAREIADRDLAATELILDADNDTSITADTDDQIDIKVGGIDTVVVTPDVLEVKGSHPDLKLLDSDDNNYGGLFYNNGSMTLATDHDATGATGIIKFAIDGNEDVRIDSGGDLTINDGNLVIGTAGHGISFAATSDASSASFSELLDDYEEGTWTPLVRGSSTAGTASYSTQIGRYTKIGNLIHVNFVLQYSITSAAGDLEITGFPYAGSGSEPNDVGVLQHNQAGASYASNVASYVPYMSSNVMSFRGNKSDGTTFASLAIQNMEYMRVTFVYTQA